MSKLINLKGSVAFVTGAGRGIGAECAKKLAEAGADVILVSRTKSELELVAEQIKSNNDVQVLIQVCDLIDSEAIKNTVSNALQRFKRIDILVNNAGVNYREKAFEVNINHWDIIMKTNIKAYFILSREIGKFMVENRKGTIINISSELSFIGVSEGQVAYSVSKAAINQLTRVLAAEWAENGVRVNTVVPGLTETKLIRELLSKPGYMEKAVNSIPLKRLGRPEDIANAVVFMASDLASFITGQILIVDGGYTTIR